MGICSICGKAQFDGPAGYVGPMCTCAFPGSYGFPRYAVYPEQKKEQRRYGELTEQDVRRLAREEVERWSRDGSWNEFFDANGVRRTGCEPARMPPLKDGTSPLETFAHEVVMGAYRPEELQAAAELALKRHAERLHSARRGD